MTYNSLVSKRFATYQFNIALLDNCTNVSLNTKEIKHHLSTSKQSHTCKNWRYELLSTISCLDDDVLYVPRDSSSDSLSSLKTPIFIISDHVSCPQRPSLKQSETKQLEMKYPMFEVWTRNYKPIKIFTLNTSFHIGFTVLSFVFMQNVLAPTGNRKKYHHELWCTYSKILIGVLKQWSCPNEFISSWRQSKWEIQKMT